MKVRGFFVASAAVSCQSGTVQDSNRAALTTPVGKVNEQRQGITMTVVSCLLLCGIRFALCELGRPLYGGMGQSLRTQEKGQALTYRGVLTLAGVIYSA